MTTPRIEVDLAKIRHNTEIVVRRLKKRGIGVTGVTKAVCGHPAIARAILEGGAVGLGDSRLNNVKRMRDAGMTCPITLIRTPMLSQVDAVVDLCETSYNTEMSVITALAAAAKRRKKDHGIILMVEMGDQREGILPQDVGEVAGHVVDMPGVVLQGIGANFACLGSTAPEAAQMATLSVLAKETEGQCGPFMQTVSGGNSANLPWAFAVNTTGRVNNLRLGEAILLGVDPITGAQIGGTYTDAFTLVAEVIETDAKDVVLPVISADPAFAKLRLVQCVQDTTRLILALGRQDTDVLGLSMQRGNAFIGATSDHLVIGAKDPALMVGTEMRFQMNYSALMQAMAAPDIETVLVRHQTSPRIHNQKHPTQHIELI